MKKIGKFLILVFAVSVFTIVSCRAQVYVKTIPTGSQTPRPKSDSRYEVWIPEDWIAVNDKYVYRGGYWAFPPTPKSVYVAGSWKKTPKGYYRVQGYWNNPHY
jgi:hypothetical protein